jgi:hypothetical protein
LTQVLGSLKTNQKEAFRTFEPILFVEL